ncbi:MAG: hypothetical protein KAS95_05940, partial [Candidatus Heimdallarchaeota archaeon]|nr:hypothetical protein [Candidatus Heimdallarchaeota archaeon]
MSYLFDEIYGKDQTNAPEVEDKILFMGLQAAGKTAIKDIVFFNKMPEDVGDYMATIHYQRQYLDDEKKSVIIDSGGQESYWNEAVTHFRHLVFSNVKLLIWVIDVTQPELFEESERRFSFTIRQFKKENPEGKIYALCHKVDLVSPEKMIVLHQHIRESFDDPKFEIEFENTSIYYSEDLKTLIFTIMDEVGINRKRFELISHIGKKIEESEEFKGYLIEHSEDPRIKQLVEFLNPEPQPILPTFGKLDITFDLSDYDIIEIVLVDKKTFSPIVGASSHSIANPEKSMEYLLALHEFKQIIKALGEEIESTGTVFPSSDNKVHSMIFNMDDNFLIITSFSEILDEKKQLFFELIVKFSQSTDALEKKPTQLTETKEEVLPVQQPEPITESIQASQIPQETEKTEIIEQHVPKQITEPITEPVVEHSVVKEEEVTPPKPPRPKKEDIELVIPKGEEVQPAKLEEITSPLLEEQVIQTKISTDTKEEQKIDLPPKAPVPILEVEKTSRETKTLEEEDTQLTSATDSKGLTIVTPPPPEIRAVGTVPTLETKPISTIEVQT